MRGIPLEDILELGRTFVLDTGELWDPEPFQVEVIRALCDGTETTWLEIPEGNAKTTLTAIICLAHLFFVQDANVPVAAASRDQAMTLFRQARGIIRRTPGLADHFIVQSGHRRILCPATAGELNVRPASADTNDGAIFTLAVLEELHRQPGLELYRTWEGKLDKLDGQLLIISTAGAPGGEYEQQKAEVIRDCERDGEVVRKRALTIARKRGYELRVHGLQPTDDLDDIDLVKEANPLRARTRKQLANKRAKPSYNRRHWARLTCGVAQHGENAAISELEWNGLEQGDLEPGVSALAGLDLGWKHDTTAITPFRLESFERRVFGTPTILTPPRDGTQLSFEHQLKPALRAVHARNPLERIAMDMNAGGQVVAEWIEKTPCECTADDPETDCSRLCGCTDATHHHRCDGGGLGVDVVDVSTSNVVQSAVHDVFMAAIRDRRIVHPHDPEFTRHVLNAVAKACGHDRSRFDRDSTSRHADMQDGRVIDALIAASGVHWHATAGLEPPKPIVKPSVEVWGRRRRRR